MNNRADVIIRDVLGRMAEGAPPVPDLRDLDSPLVHRARRSAVRRLTGIPALAAFAGVVIVGALIFSTVGRSPSGGEYEPVGSPIPGTLKEFDAAVRPGVEALLTAPGFEGVQTSFIRGHLAISIWLDARPNGDFVAVQHSDVDVTETAWWLLEEEPIASGERVSKLVTVSIGDSVYTALADDAAPPSRWDIDTSHSNYPRGTTAFEVALLSDSYERLADPSTVTRTALAGGGSVWTLTSSDEGVSTLRWFVDVDGHMVAFSGETPALSPIVQQDPIDSWNIQFTPMTGPDPITEPDQEAPLDLSDYDLPADFPLSG
jgi:hypothetical protein